MKRKTLSDAAFFAIAAALFAGLLSSPLPEAALSFSSTMQWEKKYNAVREGPLWFNIFEGWENRISIPPPPANDSPETRAELDALLLYQEARTEQRVADIREQADTPLIYDRVNAAVYGNPLLFPATSALNFIFHDVQKIIFMMKERFDRVRPSFLEPELAPAITVPELPAYPSWHATESRLIALIFSELDPEQSARYFEYAEEVTVNREWAGVTYPSDSRAGRLLADQLFAMLMEYKEFQALLERAKAEFGTVMQP